MPHFLLIHHILMIPHWHLFFIPLYLLTLHHVVIREVFGEVFREFNRDVFRDFFREAVGFNFKRRMITMMTARMMMIVMTMTNYHMKFQAKKGTNNPNEYSFQERTLSAGMLHMSHIFDFLCYRCLIWTRYCSFNIFFRDNRFVFSHFKISQKVLLRLDYGNCITVIYEIVCPVELFSFPDERNVSNNIILYYCSTAAVKNITKEFVVTRPKRYRNMCMYGTSVVDYEIVLFLIGTVL